MGLFDKRSNTDLTLIFVRSGLRGGDKSQIEIFPQVSL